MVGGDKGILGLLPRAESAGDRLSPRRGCEASRAGSREDWAEAAWGGARVGWGAGEPSSFRKSEEEDRGFSPAAPKEWSRFPGNQPCQGSDCRAHDGDLNQHVGAGWPGQQ